ncbi:MAG TPA: hypothetical protein VHK65_00500 [Candidatus Dormibacteraeota bacterium]|nr:hypothetical protein [Candidatus Dormibacteraeota bacterium]
MEQIKPATQPFSTNQRASRADLAVVSLSAILWPLGVVAMFFTKNWSLRSKVSAVGVILVCGLIFSFAPRLSGGAAAAGVTAFLLSRHPAPSRTLKIVGWTATGAVAILGVIGLYLPPLLRIGWH